MCMFVRRVCSLCGLRWTNVNNKSLDQEQDTAKPLRVAKGGVKKRKSKGCISVSPSVSVCVVTMLFSVTTSNAETLQRTNLVRSIVGGKGSS